MFSNYFPYDICKVVVVFNAPQFIRKFSVALMLFIPEGLFLVCISLFEFGFDGAAIYFVLVGVLI